MAAPAKVYVYPNGATILPYDPPGAPACYIGRAGSGLTMPSHTTISVYAEDPDTFIGTFGFSYSGYTFKEWNTSSDGTGTSYNVGDSVTGTGTIYFYAIWEAEAVDVVISYKGSTIATMSSSGTKTLETAGTYCEDDITIDYTKTGMTVVETLDPNGGTVVSISGDPVTSLQAKTVTPTSQSQTISADSGYDAISEVLVQGDSNLIGSNIASGVSIFGVVGTFAGGGDDLKNFIEQHNTISSFSNSGISVIGTGAFAYCYSLTEVSLPSCTSIESNAFANCLRLRTASFPLCTSIKSYTFTCCQSLTTVSIPLCTNIGGYAFSSCYFLATVSFPLCTSIGSYAFNRCYHLVSLYLTGSSIVNLLNSNAFSSTPIGGYTSYTEGVYGSIFVPSSLYSTYIASTNWVYFSSRFVSV